MTTGQETIYIDLFGGFRIRYKDQDTDITVTFGKKLVNLLEILVLNNGKSVSNETLYEMLWDESDDPYNSLKYSVFRLRKALAELPGMEHLSLIKTSTDGYMLNDEYNYVIDCLWFEEMYNQIRIRSDFTEADYETGMHMVELYKGRFFTNNKSPLWLTMETDKFSSHYAATIVILSKYLLRNERYEEMMKLNYNGIIMEPFYEGLHYYYMKGLIEVKDYHRALKYYDEINEKFYNELGTGLSARFKDLYKVIVEDQKDEEMKALDSITADIEQTMQESGGFYCTYEMFKHLYEITLKNAQREGKKCYLLLIDVNNTIPFTEKISLNNHLKEVIGDSIRVNDIYARLNNNQFVILLICHEMDNVHMVAQRITTRFYKKYNQKKYRLKYMAKEVYLEGY